MKKYFFFILFIGLSFSLVGKDSYFRGFYHGKNVFVRNPYLGQDSGFCIEEIYLNGDLVVENPKVSAYEIDMQNLEQESRVVIRIVHHDDCEPELTNPEVIRGDLKFSWLKVYVDENQIIWLTTKESKDGFYIVEKDTKDGWFPIDTVKTKGGIFINQHSLELDHVQGDNLYRVQYHDPEMEVKVSESFNFHSDKREITHAIDEEKWIIEFTEEVSYLLYDENSRIIKRGKDVSCNIQKLPRGKYMIKYDGKEIYFDKK
ncbi:hypothetical protein MATR_25100 [Marivirga tractuosa]|uniref:Uncharacterized protein n=1 Tax=Marivirga tractuosa (strain ATCC 23168 / DSM 4126 / NBRC 15989 / NCIMB 1408 / VKM B-1430 / H-43) TaxID=643867 RepID=E4TPU7_MARTH|nr:hypothetical protein [Marivirga tractuosa]ADR23634.1 hypothetical protein Ftrac_3665 [Marivirga tractuosa DSM 4126]BDD15685.1 hypothetical protein MATR_25100 [Marivirga tractuosa]